MTRASLALPLAGVLGSLACHPTVDRAAADGGAASAPVALDVVAVAKRRLAVTELVPAEVYGYYWVAIYPRVSAFAEKVFVDRSDVVREGQLLARLSAPELVARRAQAEATLVGDQETLTRIERAARTPGAIAKNEVELATAKVKADRDSVRALRTLEGYLDVVAPFDGVVTERDVHPGTLVGPSSGPEAMPLFRMEMLSRLRITGAVPEAYLSGLDVGAPASFTVRAWPGRKFTGVIRRPAKAVDERTRTMPVELDFENPQGEITPGMYAEIHWPIERPSPSLLVPESAVVSTPEALFVVRVKEGKVERVPVERGLTQGKEVEVFGPLSEGDQVALTATADLRPGTEVTPHLVTPKAASR
ncbi:MAG: efflux RND transporter periplasmic adaptor subunit [Deltaproteobacteria bacterium]